MSASDVAISVRGLSKRYVIAHNQEKHSTLAETVLARMKNPLARPKTEEFWALKGVEFDIQKGDIVGIIGRNGAGKSTLLKVLSRITEPTTGQVDVYGRIGSLLEVGTGFHPELTGRENVYLNGAILGMGKGEIRKQFDAIVDFAGVEKFLDTPVKRYSSGMYVRLAFAVAAHLDPEILIVDEVLSVGDAEFQKRCLGKMEDVSKNGKTVLLVSHNMAAIENLSTRVLMMNRGTVIEYGETKTTIEAYQRFLRSTALVKKLANRTDRTGTGQVRFTGFELRDIQGHPILAARSGQDVDLVLSYECELDAPTGTIDVGISLGYGDSALLSVIYGSYIGTTFTCPSRVGEFRWRIAKLPLSAGRYIVGARVLVDNTESDWPHDGIAEMVVESGDFYGTGHMGHGNAPMLIKAELTVHSDLDMQERTSKSLLEGAL